MIVLQTNNSFFSDIDDCSTNPCANGGNCTDGISDYNCSCAVGFTDKNCSTSKLRVFIILRITMLLQFIIRPKKQFPP